MGSHEKEAAGPGERVLPRSHRLVRRLAFLYGVSALAVALLMLAVLLPAGSLPRLHAFAQELVAGGAGVIAGTALLLSLTVLSGTVALTWARSRHAESAAQTASVPGGWGRWLADPGFAARQGQALIVSTGSLLILLWAWGLWPKAAPADASAANIAASIFFALAFISLVAERAMNEFPAPQLPEAPGLRRVLLLTTGLLLLAALVALGRAADFSWIRWVADVLIVAPCLVALELALRAAGRLFLPPPHPRDARAVADSILAGLLTGGPRSPGILLKTHLGLDFARSWALQFLAGALLPALLGTALFCWVLSGVKLINLGERGVYERFGAPAGVMGPGLHLLLPWPLGRLRPVELGTIHSVAIGVDQAHADEAAPVAAEATPPASLNRLWETSHPGQANYLVPSAGTGQQGFQSVSTEISVLYRVGLSDSAALQSVYSVAEPESLIRESASRLVLRYFNSRTLEAVLGARRENVAGALRDALAADMRSHQAGIDIVSVLIEEIHPPAGAAAAYHAVQAAEINASASISDERGRAKRVAGVAQQESHQLTAAADAHAAEITHTADAEAYRFDADRHASQEGGRSFLLERSFSSLKGALGRTPLTIMDSRLPAATGPVLDLRASGASGAPPRPAQPFPGAAAAAGTAPETRGSTVSTTPSYTPNIEEQD